MTYTGLENGEPRPLEYQDVVATTTSQLKRAVGNKNEILALQKEVNKQRRAAAAILKRRFDKMPPAAEVAEVEGVKRGKGRPPLPKEKRKYSRHIVTTDSLWADLLLLSDFYGVASRSEVIAQLVKEKFVRLKEQHTENPENPFSI